MGQQLEKHASKDIERLIQNQILKNTKAELATKLEDVDKLSTTQAIHNAYPFTEKASFCTHSHKPLIPRLEKVQKIDLQASPITEYSGRQEEALSTKDERKLIVRTDHWPHSVHGVVSMKFNEKRKWGTGIIIGPNIVLTAAHNLYDHNEKVYAELNSIEFLPGVNGNTLPFGLCRVKQYFVPKDFIAQGKEDYALLILDTSVGEMTGYFGLAILEQGEIKSKKLHITGYPADKVADKSKVYEMWTMDASGIDIDKDYISYMGHTCGGQDGSGVWYYEDEEYQVVGVHIHGNHLRNKATLLTKQRYQQIREWIAEAYEVKLEDSIYEQGCRSLLLGYESLTVNELSFIIKYPWANTLTLGFGGNQIDDDGAVVLSQNTTWKSLTRLYLHNNKISDKGIKALAENTTWKNLLKLNLYGNQIGDEGAEALAKNTIWINLLNLDLHVNKIGDDGVKALSRNSTWTEISGLDLSFNRIGDEGAEALALNTKWTNLKELILSNNKIGIEGAKGLAKNVTWVNLERLDVSRNEIQDEGAKFLSKNRTWKNLLQLNVSCNKIGDEGAKALLQNTKWKNLTELDLHLNEISEEGTQIVKKKTNLKVKLSL